MDSSPDVLRHTQSRSQCIDGSSRMRKEGELCDFEFLANGQNVICIGNVVRY